MTSTVLPPPPKASDYLAEVITVQVAALFVDHRYQRGIKKSSVKNLVEHWTWKRYLPIIVSPRGGQGIDRYAVIDGQQRHAAAIELGIPELPAIMLVAASLEDEAELFVGANTGAPVGAGDRFRAEYLRREPRYVAIYNDVIEAGFQLTCVEKGHGQGTKDPFAIEAVHTTEMLYNRGSLGRVLRFIATTWGGVPVKDMVTSPFLEGVHLALKHLDRFGVDEAKLGKSLESTPVKELLDMGHDRYKSMVTSRSIPGGIAAVIVERYNYRKRADLTVPAYDRAAARAMNPPRHTTANSQAGGRAASAVNPREGGRFVRRVK